MKLTHAVELTIRGHDRLDEAMHAGYFFYILVGTSRFVGIDSFIYPVALTTFSHFLPVIHNYYNYMYETQRNALNFGGQGLMVAAYFALGVSLIILPRVVVFFYQVKAKNASLWTEAYNYLYSINS